MIDTEVNRPDEAAAFQAQALIEEARLAHRRRQRRTGFRVIAAALFLAIAASVVILSTSRSPDSTTTPPRVGSPSARTHDTAYVTTSKGILKVDLAAKKVVGRINPHGSDFALEPIAIAPSDRTAFVVSDNIFTPIDLASGSPMTPITLGSSTEETADATGFPSSIAITPDGRTAYVAIPGLGTIVPVRLAPLAVADPILLGGTPESVTIAPNGETAYITNRATSAIDVVNVATDAVESPINGIADPEDIAITPNGKRAYVSTETAIIPIDLLSNRVMTPIKVGSIRTGFVPGAIVVSPDGHKIYVAMAESGTEQAEVLVLSAASNKIVARLGGFSGPGSIAVSDDGQMLYVLNTAPSPGQVIGSVHKHAVLANALVPIDLNNDVVREPILIPVTPRAFGITEK